jgi:hypothetical protein
MSRGKTTDGRDTEWKSCFSGVSRTIPIGPEIWVCTPRTHNGPYACAAVRQASIFSSQKVLVVCLWSKEIAVKGKSEFTQQMWLEKR